MTPASRRISSRTARAIASRKNSFCVAEAGSEDIAQRLGPIGIGSSGSKPDRLAHNPVDLTLQSREANRAQAPLAFEPRCQAPDRAERADRGHLLGAPRLAGQGRVAREALRDAFQE